MKLPKFIYDKLKNNKTYLGDNPAFPPDSDVPFAYKVIKSGFEESLRNLDSVVSLETYSISDIKNMLSSMITECVKIERPFITKLEKLCLYTVCRLFNIPDGTINISCELTPKIKPSHSFRIYPEDIALDKFRFKNIAETKSFKKALLKRRFINALVLGGAQTYAVKNMNIKGLFDIDERLPKLYSDIITLNTYLLYNEKEDISDKHPRQGACVEVLLGREGELTNITAQGVIYPFLLQETIRGLLELFASHGLPKNNTKAEIITKQADFLAAEPWDLRFGIKLWPMLFGPVNDTYLIPYMFTELCSLKSDEFNKNVSEILADTQYGELCFQKLMDNAIHDLKMADLQLSLINKSQDKDVIEDEYVSLNEIDDLQDDEIYI